MFMLIVSMPCLNLIVIVPIWLSNFLINSYMVVKINQFSPAIAIGGGWNHLMIELTPESDDTSGESQKKINMISQTQFVV
jgi:hypothetical protein